MFSWPLNKSQFTFLDRIRLAKFVFFDDQWTQGKHVKAFEQAMSEYVGSKYAVFVSSGSTANTILAMRLKDSQDKNSKKSVVVFPSTTWTTSISPFLREGFTPHFVDISMDDLGMDLFKLNHYLKENYQKVACVFVTSLIGMTPDIGYLQYLSNKYNVKIMIDNCENTLGTFDGKNVSSFFTSTTSTYFGHQIQSVEGGFIFTNDEEEYHYCLMARNHGMVRAVPENRRWVYENRYVDSRFDFHMLGNNFRNSDIHAFIGLMDLKRADYYKKKRQELFCAFRDAVDEDVFLLPEIQSDKIESVPFCLPIILQPSFCAHVDSIKRHCHQAGIETRPIISGNLLRQTCYKKFSPSPFLFKNSQYLHDYGFYIGLHAKVKERDVVKLAEKLSE